MIDREIGSMTEFKQIVGRGTRVHEDTKKFFFTLIDFRKATNHFADPDFDGEPVQIYQPTVDDSVVPPDSNTEEDEFSGGQDNDETILVDWGTPDISIVPGPDLPRKFYVKGQPVSVLVERVEYVDEDGKLVTESLRDYTKKAIRKRFVSLDDFLSQWNAAHRKQVIIDELALEGLLLEPLAEEVGKELDPFDLICHVAFDQPPLTRRERAERVRKRDIFTKYGAKAKAVLEALLQKYQDEGMTTLDDPRILQISPFDSMGTPLQLIKEFGDLPAFEKAVHDLQSALYHQAA